jgi:hypothetical protein
VFAQLDIHGLVVRLQVALHGELLVAFGALKVLARLALRRECELCGCATQSARRTGTVADTIRCGPSSRFNVYFLRSFDVMAQSFLFFCLLSRTTAHIPLALPFFILTSAPSLQFVVFRNTVVVFVFFVLLFFERARPRKSQHEPQL